MGTGNKTRPVPAIPGSMGGEKVDFVHAEVIFAPSLMSSPDREVSRNPGHGNSTPPLFFSLLPVMQHLPLEVINIDIDEDDDLDIRPMRHHQYRRDRDPYGTIV